MNYAISTHGLESNVHGWDWGRPPSSGRKICIQETTHDQINLKWFNSVSLK